jgi:hypothetical protein
MDSRQETSGMTADRLVHKTPNRYYVILEVSCRGSRIKHKTYIKIFKIK